MTDRFSEIITDTTAIIFDGELVLDERSRYQHIQVYKHDYYGYILVLDGLYQMSTTDEYLYSEMMAHIPLCGLAREPRRVLMVGGGDGGTLAQVLRHPSVEYVKVVELDEAVVNTSKRFFPFAATAFVDKKVSITYMDAAVYMKQPDPPELFDAAILDTSDPETPAKVLYTREFYSNVRRFLAPDGILMHQIGTTEFTPEYLSGTVDAMSPLFPWVGACLVPMFTYAGAQAFVVASDRDVSKPHREILGKWYNSEIHAASFALPTFWRNLVIRPKTG
ncbi:MAG: spermidine synthase [Candidatus Brocadiia bacterium]